MKFLKALTQNTLILVLGFVIFNLVLRVDGGGNPAARIAQLASLVEYRSFSIDAYVEQVDPQKNWTADWAQGPDGHYYSNKAPGPVFLAYPFYWAIDKIFFNQDNVDSRNASRLASMELISFLLSLLLQVLPFSLLLFFGSNAMNAQKYSQVAILWTLFALAFANTNSLFMNTFFGHGLTAVFILSACYVQVFSKTNSRFFWVAMFWGWALLCDYSVTFAIPLILLWLWKNKPKKNFKVPLFLFFLGALLPGFLWIFYHYQAFGSPFKIALHFQNPVFATAASSGKAELSRVIGWVPSFDIVLRLLKGSSRGILFTQVFVLLAFIFAFKRANYFVWGSLLFFVGVFWMNAAFPNWWAGASPGPRYLSPAFIPLILVLSLHFDSLGIRAQKLLIFLLVPSLVLFSLVMSQSILIDNTPLWRDLGFRLLGANLYAFSASNLIQFVASSVLLIYFYWKFLMKRLFA